MPFRGVVPIVGKEKQNKFSNNNVFTQVLFSAASSLSIASILSQGGGTMGGKGGTVPPR